MSEGTTINQIQQDIARGNDEGKRVLAWDPVAKRLVIKPSAQANDFQVGHEESIVGDSVGAAQGTIQMPPSARAGKTATISAEVSMESEDARCLAWDPEAKRLRVMRHKDLQPDNTVVRNEPAFVD
jgi:hypothetical protein